MKNETPIRTRVRPFNPEKRTALQKEVDDLVSAGVIRPSKSIYASAPVLVKKKDGTWRLAIDYRRINQESEDFPYPLPLIRELFNAFYGAQCYSSIDLARGYWQIGMDPESVQYTAFVTQWRQFEFLVMPFELKQAPGWFQLLMNEVLRPVLGKCAVVYLDDVIIFSRNPKQHVKDVIQVLELIRQAHLQVKLRKCEFFKKAIKFLGYRISGEGIQTNEDKVKAMREVSAPTNIREVQSVMGLFNYYQLFVPNFSTIARPIYALIKKDQEFYWEPEQEQALEILKKKMTEALILIHSDFGAPFFLYTDASYIGFGYILAQERNGKEYSVAYGSKRTLPAERNYSVTDLEGAALVWAVEQNRHYFNMRTPITIITDHKALATWFTQELPENHRRARWILKMSQYNFKIKHCQGRSLAHVDYLSRNPILKIVSFRETPNL